jgi:hypothetical protein
METPPYPPPDADITCSCRQPVPPAADARDADARELDLLQGDLRTLLDMIPPGTRSSRPSRDSVYARVLALISLTRRVSGAGGPRAEMWRDVNGEAFAQWRADRAKVRP